MTYNKLLVKPQLARQLALVPLLEMFQSVGIYIIFQVCSAGAPS